MDSVLLALDTTAYVKLGSVMVVILVHLCVYYIIYLYKNKWREKIHFSIEC